MKADKEKIIKKMREIFTKLLNDKKPLLILAVGILGIFLIFISETGNKTQEKPQENECMSADEYEQRLTQQLQKIVSQIDGAGNTEVMLTVDRLRETVYAADTKERTENQNNGENSSDNEYEYIVIKGSGSAETGLVRVVVEPKVRGVSVVCDGGDNMT
ncbi:MAG: hypothetical protein MJ177_09980, partial [Clostridia bacterium]|nr:hypothetical protein [Clostridia bacterium]